VKGLEHKHTRARPMLTATQIMLDRNITLGGSQLLLPQFLGVVQIAPNTDRAWVVSNATRARTALTADDDEFDGDEVEFKTSDEVSLVADCDVEAAELVKYLALCGFSREDDEEEYARALRAHSACTVEDTLEFHSARNPNLERRGGCYPDAYIECYVREEDQRIKNRLDGAACAGAVTFTESMRRQGLDVGALSKLGKLDSQSAAARMMAKVAQRESRTDGCKLTDRLAAEERIVKRLRTETPGRIAPMHSDDPESLAKLSETQLERAAAKDRTLAVTATSSGMPHSYFDDDDCDDDTDF
jgi:hypothetical protein